MYHSRQANTMPPEYLRRQSVSHVTGNVLLNENCPQTVVETDNGNSKTMDGDFFWPPVSGALLRNADFYQRFKI
jgi:hypothetical protein